MALEKEHLDVYQFPITKDGAQIDFAKMDSNTHHPQHIHDAGSAKLYVISGKGMIHLNDKSVNYASGDTFDVPKGTAHGFSVEEETLLLSIQDHPILQGDKLDFRYK
ncbi:MAG: cupin domain-containing protein [Candidatus Taylorbacteria bacterium]|nr:cupin domain-containing protein [Candidatus Taylorbacteria bacterium]